MSTKEKALALHAKGVDKLEISKETGADIDIINSWLSNADSLNREIDSRLTKVKNLLREWEEAGVTGKELIPGIKTQIIATIGMVTDLMSNPGIITNAESAQSLHIHSRTLRELFNILRDSEESKAETLRGLFDDDKNKNKPDPVII